MRIIKEDDGTLDFNHPFSRHPELRCPPSAPVGPEHPRFKEWEAKAMDFRLHNALWKLYEAGDKQAEAFMRGEWTPEMFKEAEAYVLSKGMKLEWTKRRWPYKRD